MQEKSRTKVFAIPNDVLYNRDIEDEIEVFLDLHDASIIDTVTDERGNVLIFVEVYDKIETSDVDEYIVDL